MSESQAKRHIHQQLLTLAQEMVLATWIKFLGFIGFPLSKRTIGPKVQALCRQKPSRCWIIRFLSCNPECTLRQPASLDPQHAKAFNFTTVSHHFNMLQDLFDSK